jgi:hypothetical protein
MPAEKCSALHKSTTDKVPPVVKESSGWESLELLQSTTSPLGV